MSTEVNSIKCVVVFVVAVVVVVVVAVIIMPMSVPILSSNVTRKNQIL